MKTMKFLGILFCLVLGCGMTNAEKRDTVVIFKSVISCGKCKAKVEKNIAFEKGVRDLKVNTADSLITVKFRKDKNTVGDLKEAIEKCHVRILGLCTPDGKLFHRKENGHCLESCFSCRILSESPKDRVYCD